MSKHVIERYVSKHIEGNGCGIHRASPGGDNGQCCGAYVRLHQDDCEREFGFVPDAGKYKKVRITVEVLQEPPPKPKLCWFESRSTKWAGFMTFDGKCRVQDGNGSEVVFWPAELENIEIHWYDDEEPANCE